MPCLVSTSLNGFVGITGTVCNADCGLRPHCLVRRQTRGRPGVTTIMSASGDINTSTIIIGSVSSAESVIYLDVTILSRLWYQHQYSGWPGWSARHEAMFLSLSPSCGKTLRIMNVWFPSCGLKYVYDGIEWFYHLSTNSGQKMQFGMEWMPSLVSLFWSSWFWRWSCSTSGLVSSCVVSKLQ